MRTATGDFDLVITEKHCDIIIDDVALLLPITMTLEACVEICCEKMGTEFIEILWSRDQGGERRGNGSYVGEFSYVY